MLHLGGPAAPSIAVRSSGSERRPRTVAHLQYRPDRRQCATRSNRATRHDGAPTSAQVESPEELVRRWTAQRPDGLLYALRLGGTDLATLRTFDRLLCLLRDAEATARHLATRLDKPPLLARARALTEFFGPARAVKSVATAFCKDQT